MMQSILRRKTRRRQDGGEEETSESQESGDLGIDRSTTFRVKKKEVEEAEEVEIDSEKVLRKLEDLESLAVTSRLSELNVRDIEQPSQLR